MKRGIKGGFQPPFLKRKGPEVSLYSLRDSYHYSSTSLRLRSYPLHSVTTAPYTGIVSNCRFNYFYSTVVGLACTWPGQCISIYTKKNIHKILEFLL